MLGNGSQMTDQVLKLDLMTVQFDGLEFKAGVVRLTIDHIRALIIVSARPNAARTCHYCIEAGRRDRSFRHPTHWVS